MYDLIREYEYDNSRFYIITKIKEMKKNNVFNNKDVMNLFKKNIQNIYKSIRGSFITPYIFNLYINKRYINNKLCYEIEYNHLAGRIKIIKYNKKSAIDYMIELKIYDNNIRISINRDFYLNESNKMSYLFRLKNKEADIILVNLIMKDIFIEK